MKFDTTPPPNTKSHEVWCSLGFKIESVHLPGQCRQVNVYKNKATVSEIPNTKKKRKTNNKERENKKERRGRGKKQKRKRKEETENGKKYKNRKHFQNPQCLKESHCCLLCYNCDSGI